MRALWLNLNGKTDPRHCRSSVFDRHLPRERGINNVVSRLTAVLLMLLYACSAVAADVKIGFVDIPYLIDEAPQAHAASIRLEQEFAPRQAAIKGRKSNLEKLREQLDDESLDNTKRLSIQREFNKTERRVKRDEQEFREELNIQKNQEFKQVRVYVLEAIATFAKLNNYDLIISDGVLFANKKIDVTEQVLFHLQEAVELASDAEQSNDSSK